MNTTPSWVLDSDRLRESLAEWHSTKPSVQHKSYVNKFLMDLMALGPFECGELDEESGSFSGIAGNVVGSMIVIAYVADFDRLRIAVTGITLAG